MTFYVVGGLWVLYKYKWSGLWILLFAVATILLSDQSSNLIKHLVHRLRPCAVEPSVRLLVAHCSDTFSFTSNHAANHFAIATFITLLFRPARWISGLLILWASFIAFSQVYVGLHYPADVIAGGILGGIIAWIMVLTLLRVRKDIYKEFLFVKS